MSTDPQSEYNTIEAVHACTPPGKLAYNWLRSHRLDPETISEVRVARDGSHAQVVSIEGFDLPSGEVITKITRYPLLNRTLDAGLVAASL